MKKFRKIQKECKEYLDTKKSNPTFIKVMRASGMPLTCKAFRNATSGRNKTDTPNPKMDEAKGRGRMKQLAFIMRGIKLAAPEKMSLLKKLLGKVPIG